MQQICKLLHRTAGNRVPRLSSRSWSRFLTTEDGTGGGEETENHGNEDGTPSSVPQQEDDANLERLVQEWSQLRRTRLTASVFAFAIGFWDGRRVQLWKEKIGLLEPFEGNLATNWGTLKEATAIQQYIKLTDNKVHHQLFKSYPHGTSMPDWMGASPDGLVYSKSAYMLENGGILEVKCPFNKGRPDLGTPWPYVPYYYMPQAQGLLEIFDRNWMDFYVWTMNGSSIYRIDRNPDLWELMLTALNDFWWGHVVPAKQMLSKDPDADVRRFKPGPHHPLFLTIANKCKQVADRSPLLLHDRTPQLVSRYNERECFIPPFPDKFDTLCSCQITSQI